MDIKEFRHGRKLSCKITGTPIDDGVVSIDEKGEIYICEDIKSGWSTRGDKFGHLYSWLIYDPRDNSSFEDSIYVRRITDIVWKDELETWQRFHTGDIITDGTCYARCLFANEWIWFRSIQSDTIEAVDRQTASSCCHGWYAWSWWEVGQWHLYIEPEQPKDHDPKYDEIIGGIRDLLGKAGL